MLDMSEIEANKLKLTHGAFDLRNSLQKAVSFIHFRMEEKLQRFSMNVDDNAPLLYVGDELRLTQVITSLLSNAVKFTPEGGVLNLDVSLAGEEDEVCELRFEVADNGIGITSEHLEKIFRMFEQVEGGTTRKFGGMGLGLAISKHLVELMGGNISVESELGKGSRFTFTVKLPREVKDSLTQPVPSGKSEADMEDKDDEFAGKKLLLADDVAINRDILMMMLDDTGLTIDIAENGREALDMITIDPDLYDFVFMDMQMPEMDGLEATRQIRALPMFRDKKLPIVAMTANTSTEDVENCLAAGMDDHVGKPIDRTVVIEKLRKYL
jgi:CheY-like chemotaxis protein